MALIIATTVFSALYFLCRFFIHAEAYVVDKSCKPYLTDNVDKTSMINAAMAEANEMMTHAAWMLDYNLTRVADNSRDALFPGARTQDLINIAGQLNALRYRCRSDLLLDFADFVSEQQ